MCVNTPDRRASAISTIPLQLLSAVLFNDPILSGLRLLVMLGHEVMKGYGGGLLDYFIQYIYYMIYIKPNQSEYSATC